MSELKEWIWIVLAVGAVMASILWTGRQLWEDQARVSRSQVCLTLTNTVADYDACVEKGAKQ